MSPGYDGRRAPRSGWPRHLIRANRDAASMPR
jgi:hypothetical protein